MAQTQSSCGCSTQITHGIPAGIPWTAKVKIQRKAASETEYVDILDPSKIPGAQWSLHFVNERNMSRIKLPLDWSKMTETGYIDIALTEEQTNNQSGQKLHIEVRNDSVVSDLIKVPDDIFYFIPNNIPK